MRLGLLLIFLSVVLCDDSISEQQNSQHEILRQLEEGPRTAFHIDLFSKPKFGLNLQTNDRLPRDVVVHSYNLQIEPFFRFAGFKYHKALHNTIHGAVSIVFSVIKPTDKIELTSAVTVHSMALRLDRQKLKILKSETDKNDHLNIYVARKLEPKRNYTLQFKYSNKMSPSHRGGVFSFEYLNPEKQKTALVATIFEPIYAREAFPCFDDPFFKATFNISLIHPNNAKAYSNEDIEDVKYFDEQRVVTHFKPTPKMSTYLVAFAIGDFAETTALSKSGVLNRAITTRNRKDFVQDSSQAGADCVNAMEKLLNTKYPLKKLDHLDSVMLASGGMENFGLNIYRGYMPHFFGQSLPAAIFSRRIICHVTAQQWFGGLVTADHWGLEFLHESFADYFETHTMEQMEEFKTLAESNKFSRYWNAIGNYARAPHSVVDNSSHFDYITDSAGGGLLLAVRHVLTDEVFYKGLAIYLQENAYGNAGLDTLLQSWVKARGSDILCGSIMFTDWAKDHFLRPGVPIVRIDLELYGDYIITQTGYKGHKWNLPIFVLDMNTDTEHTIWLRKDGQLCSNDNFALQRDGVYVFNNEGKGFADFKVDGSLMIKTKQHPNFNNLSQPNIDYNLYALRSVLSDDDLSNLVYELAKARNGRLAPSEYSYVRSDRPKYNETVTLVSDNFDFSITAENRILGWNFFLDAIRLNVTSAQQRAVDFFEEFKHDCADGRELVECPQIPPEWRSAVYAQGARTEDGRKFLEQYKKRIEAHPWKDWLSPEYYRVLNTE